MRRSTISTMTPQALTVQQAGAGVGDDFALAQGAIVDADLVGQAFAGAWKCRVYRLIKRFW